MNLGETIYRLRTERNMSQGDLADALDVSRQSVSKWETNGSVPDLDKLIKISEIFGVTLDELVLNKTQDKTPPQPIPEQKIKPEPKASQKTTGIILCCFSAMVWLMVSLFGDVAAGIVMALPFLICGLICLFVARRAGLWCGWTVYLAVDIYLRYATGVNWKFVMRGLFYDGTWMAQLVIAWCLLVFLALMLFFTVLNFVKKPLQPTKLRIGFLIGGWCLFALSFVPLPITSHYMAYSQTIIGIFDWARNVLLALLLIRTVRMLRAKRMRSA